VTGWSSLELSGSHENGGVGCAWWLRAEAEVERGRECGPDSVHHTERRGGGPGGDFAIRGGPDASRAQMWRRLLGGMTGEVLGGHMWEGKGHVGHGRRAWAGGLGPV
jgi:hypothetical protein